MPRPRSPQHRLYAKNRPTGTLAVLVMMGFACWAPGCRNRAEPAPARQVLTVATAFAPFSTRLTEEYRRTLPDIDIQERPGASSGEVLRLIQDGTLDFGIALADDAYRAYFGERPDATRPDSAVRALSLLQPLPTYLLARAGSGVHRVEDLKGKVVAVGPQNVRCGNLARSC